MNPPASPPVPAPAAADASAGTFRQFCETEMMPRLRALDVRRKKVLAVTFGFAGCVLTFGGMFVYAVEHDTPSLIWLPIVGAAVFGAVLYSKYASYCSAFKSWILPEIAGFIDGTLQYEAEGAVSQDTFEDGRLFKQAIERYKGEDHVHGRLGRTAFEFSEVHAEYETESTDSKGNTRTKWHTIFKGLYFVADFNKHFRTRTVVLPDTAERMLGFIGRALQARNPSRANLIRLEDPEFEREFVVYGDDQVEARYILTPALMQRMLALKEKVGAPVYFAFTGSAVHVAIATGKNFFEPRLFSTLVDINLLEEFHDDLRLVTGIIEDLNLNTRIWTKT